MSDDTIELDGQRYRVVARTPIRTPSEKIVRKGDKKKRVDNGEVRYVAVRVERVSE
jgi:hypothetical protein